MSTHKRRADVHRAARRLGAAMALVLTLSGCAALPTILSGLSSAINVAEWTRARAGAGLPPAAPGDARLAGDEPRAADTYQAAVEEAYRQGVRDAVRQLSEGLGRDPRWTWVAPIVQEVWIPAQVVNGVFIPGHREWVLIRPGQWQAQFGLPLGPPPQIQPTGGRAAESAPAR